MSCILVYLRELLRTDALKPGATIQSGTLARHLGVSKTPLRDALIQLQTEGFLKILPQRGVVINTLDTKELNELIQVLAGLESKAVSQIRKYKEHMYHCPDRNYGDIWRKKNADEHQQIITFIQDGGDQMAADFLRDIHWSFDLNKQKLRIRR
jgi:DNA-binding GntR family transcriptional regulator